MDKFPVGTRVRVYNAYTDNREWVLEGEVIDITDEGMLRIRTSSGTMCAHPKQCRRLVKRRRIWIKDPRRSLSTFNFKLEQEVFLYEPPALNDYIEFVEVGRKK